MSDLVNADASVQVTPFHSSAPEFDYWGSAHRQAAEHLQSICKNPTFLNLFTGRGGSGKSTVARRVVWDSQEELLIGVVPYSADLSVDPCQTIISAFGADSESSGKDSCYKDLSDHLRRASVQFGLPTLIVDDAHRLTDKKQQALFDLAGFDLKEGPLFKILLVGQTGLFDQIGPHQKRLLGSSLHLETMTKEDTSGYIQHRFAAAGAGAMPFTDAAIDVIHEIADGNPVRINLVCMRALDEAEMQWIDTIDGDMVRECYNPARMALDLAKVTGVRLSSVPVSTPTENLAEPSRTILRLNAPVMKESETIPKTSVIETETAPGQKPSMAPPLGTAASSSQPSAVRSEGPDDISDSIERTSSASAPKVTLRARPGQPAPPRATELGEEWRVPAASLQPARSIVDNSALVTTSAGLSKPRRRLGRWRTAATGICLAAAVAAIAWISLVQDGAVDQPAQIEASVMKTVPQPSDMDGQVSEAVMKSQFLHSDADSRQHNPVFVRQALIDDPNLPLIRSVPVIPVAVDSDAATRLIQIRSALGNLPETPNERFRRAIEVAGQQPEAAVVAYALAAYDGHSRAAYYLAQMYELGEGIAVDLILARSWYERAVGDNGGAGGRLEALQKYGPVAAIAPPVPLYAGRAETSKIELAWTSGEGGDPTTYAVEFADQSGRILHRESNLVLSALRTAFPKSAVYWRVEAQTSEGGETAVGGWLPLNLDASGFPLADQANLKTAPLHQVSQRRASGP
ncbi:MAG: AAA family ATPase [Paracoccaceae bacterium]